MRFGNQGRNNSNLNFAGIIRFDRGKELDAIVQLISEADISGGDFFNSFDKHIGGIDPKTIRQRSKDDSLVSRIPTIHIECRISLCIAQFLSIREHRRKISPLLRHASENVVAGAIEDSMNRLKTISHKGLADGFDDRYAASHSRLIKNRHTLLVGQLKNLTPVFR